MQSDNPDLFRQSDPMDPARAAALQVAFGEEGMIGAGYVLPPFFHQIYFWTPESPARLGRDGHPQVGLGVIPDMGLPRRMWAGGQLQFHRDLRAGVPAEKTTVCETAERKQGRSGPLAFVKLRHEIRQEGALCVTEWQDLVYREDPRPDAPVPAPPEARTDEEQAELRSFDSTLLFRYSALTFNGHRIHYDPEYARDVEGYRGLVVHGPLLAHLLMQMAFTVFGSLDRFEFRATAPLMHFETAEFCRAGRDFWVRGPDGRQCMVARA
jgi:3-methylfumaryl-CoA hydratase